MRLLFIILKDKKPLRTTKHIFEISVAQTAPIKPNLGINNKLNIIFTTKEKIEQNTRVFELLL